MSLAAAGRVARVAPLRRARAPARRASRAPVARAPPSRVLEKMVGKWEDNIRYIEPELDKTPVKLVGVREFAVEGDVVIRPRRASRTARRCGWRSRDGA